MTRAKTIARLRIARHALYSIAAASFLFILLGAHKGENESAASSENERHNRTKTVAFLPPNKELKIDKASGKK
jgi:hypothetical protein